MMRVLGSLMEGAATKSVLMVRIRVMLKEDRCGAMMTFSCGVVKRRVSGRRLCMGICPVFEQGCDDGVVPVF